MEHEHTPQPPDTGAPPVVNAGMFTASQIRRQNEEELAWFVRWRNKRILERYLDDARDWGINHGRTPKPAIPFEEEGVLLSDEEFTFKLVPTSRPISDVKPEAYLPKFGADKDGIGGPVGGPIIDNEGPPQKYHCSSTDNLEPGQFWSAPDGRRFIKVARGFAGMSRYWIEIK